MSSRRFSESPAGGIPEVYSEESKEGCVHQVMPWTQQLCRKNICLEHGQVMKRHRNLLNERL